MNLIKRTAIANFSIMDQYLPGLMSVIYGKAQPKAAIEEAERPEEEKSNDDQEGESQSVSENSGQESTETNRTARLLATTRRPLVSRATRTSQFARYLRLMKKRALDEAKCDCFLRFSAAAGAIGPELDENPLVDPKMVQFCFHEKWFAIDVPSTYLCPPEAEKVLRERRGFYREAAHPEVNVTKNVNDLVQFDPIGRKYIYGDEQEAAEDTAYVLYDVWELDPDAELLVTASPFGRLGWEKDALLG